jgi:hypothetical protein
MKQLFTLFLVTIIWACGQKANNPTDQSALDKAAADTANYTTIEWLDSVANFGSVDAGKKVEVKFRFKNTGAKPLILTEVRAGCGCTTPEWTKEPVAPGKEGYVTGIFNSANQHGEVHKMISVRSNTKNGVEHKLTFTGLVNEQLPEPVKTN